MKEALKKWNSNVFGFCDTQLKRLYDKLSVLQQQQDEAASDEEVEVQLEILELENRMGRIWKQKSRDLWVSLGDCNSKFFHVSTLIRRRRNSICAINDVGNGWLFDREGIGAYFNKQFQLLYESQQPVFDNDFDSLFQPLVTDLDNAELFRCPSFEEIRQVVWKDFFISRKFVEKLNHTFLCLIPKSENPTSFDQFRPISLCNFGYKIIARLLTDRLKPVLDKLATAAEARILGQCLEKYEEWSGQKVSRRKSGLVFSPKVQGRDKSCIQEILDLQLLDKKERYLGNPFFYSARRRDDFKFIKEKLLNRLEGWKAKQ
ncbi:uncharacterized protein LOC115710637 [Cannabis sativa]|uniref:uncharacterized protein LOC115710637 n=1 Tax=Cannabis sativa TaxID=3483 RepID=UPI0029C9E80B|nr:uncharacterized protein LOC115710637 [Cannabis sativa]